jgi:hypothetical protein
MTRQRVCDGCGKTVPEDDPQSGLWGLYTPHTAHKEVDLCPECSAEVEAFIKKLGEGGGQPAE